MSSFHPDMYELMRGEQTKMWAFVERPKVEEQCDSAAPRATATEKKKQAVVKSTEPNTSRKLTKAALLPAILANEPCPPVVNAKTSSSKPLTEQTNLYSIDLTKCRRHCLYYSKH